MLGGLEANLRLAHTDSTHFIKANIRRTNVATKLKLTYLKDEFLDVRMFVFVAEMSHLILICIGQDSVQSLCVIMERPLIIRFVSLTDFCGF